MVVGGLVVFLFMDGCTYVCTYVHDGWDMDGMGWLKSIDSIPPNYIRTCMSTYNIHQVPSIWLGQFEGKSVVKLTEWLWSENQDWSRKNQNRAS